MDFEQRIATQNAVVAGLRTELQSAGEAVLTSMARFVSEWWEAHAKSMVGRRATEGVLMVDRLPKLKQEVRALQAMSAELTRHHLASYFVHQLDDTHLLTFLSRSGMGPDVRLPARRDRLDAPLRKLMGLAGRPMRDAGLETEGGAFQGDEYRYSFDLPPDAARAVEAYEDLASTLILAIGEVGLLLEDKVRYDAEQLWEQA